MHLMQTVVALLLVPRKGASRKRQNAFLAKPILAPETAGRQIPTKYLSAKTVKKWSENGLNRGS